MERKIGEIFEHNGEWYQCIRSSDCSKCDLKIIKDCRLKFPCESLRREDCEEVIFKKLEKVGEPYTHYCPSGRIIYFQRYKIFNKSYSHNTEYIMCDFNEDDIVSIELKQTKEDMEEKKIQLKREDIDYLTRKIRYLVYKTNDYDRATEEIMNLFIPSDTEHSSSEKIGKNLKPFDLEAAKAGKPVCTRDGRKVRIICFDRKFYHDGYNYPIVAVINDNNNEPVRAYTQDGLFVGNGECELDLMMLPEKKEGWINISSCPDNGYSNYDSGVIVFKTKEEAVNFTNNKDYIDTVKVTWEE
jgi:hypothetical protein